MWHGGGSLTWWGGVGRLLMVTVCKMRCAKEAGERQAERQAGSMNQTQPTTKLSVPETGGKVTEQRGKNWGKFTRQDMKQHASEVSGECTREVCFHCLRRRQREKNAKSAGR